MPSRCAMVRFFPIAAGVATIVCLAPATGARRVVLTSTKDTTLHGPFGTQLSNGAGPSVFSGATQSFGVRRALLQFATLADSLPAGAQVDSVQVQLHVDRAAAGSFVHRLHRVLADWGEAGSSSTGGGGAIAQAGDATWSHAFWETILWTTAGGDFATSASAQSTVGGIGDYTWGSTAALVADVQAWVDDSESNFGWILIGDEAQTSAKRFDSHESANAAGRPRLVVDFSPATAVLPVTWGAVKQLYESSIVREGRR